MPACGLPRTYALCVQKQGGTTPVGPREIAQISGRDCAPQLRRTGPWLRAPVAETRPTFATGTACASATTASSPTTRSYAAAMGHTAAHTQCTVHTYLQYLRDGKDAVHRDDCVLCKAPLASAPAVRLPCFDTFHWACVVGAADPAAVRCPTCRTPLLQPGDSPIARQVAAFVQGGGASPTSHASTWLPQPAKAMHAGVMAIEIGPAAEFFKNIPSGRRDSANDSSTCLLLPMSGASARPFVDPGVRSAIPAWLHPPRIPASGIPRMRAIVVLALGATLAIALLVFFLR